MIELPEAHKQALADHLAAHYGAVEGELQVPTEAGPCTLLHVPPTPEVPFHVLVSAGLSAAPMPVPDDVEGAPRFAELLLLLPFDWPVEAGLDHPKTSWPLRVLGSIAVFPFLHDAWLGLGHSMPNGEPPAPFVGGLDFCGVMIAPPMSLPPEGRSFVRSDGAEVALLGVLPVFERELELKQEKGMGEVLQRFDRAQVNELLDIERKSVAGIFLELLDRESTD